MRELGSPILPDPSPMPANTAKPPGCLSGGRRVHRKHPASQCRPVITVATVVYNGAKTFEHAMKSVLDQGTDHVEYLIIDGGSNDGTLDAIMRHDERIDFWISEPDAGIYDAMNKARQVATGDWLLFLGADDELLAPLGSVVKRFTNPSALYYGNVRIAATGKISGGLFSRYRLMQENICHQAIFYPRSVYKAKAYHTASGYLADHRYNIELMGSGVPFIHIDETISCFNDAGRSSSGAMEFEAIKLAAIRESFGLPMYLVKRCRTLLARLLKARRVAA